MTETSVGAGLVRSFVAVPLPSAVQREISLAARHMARDLPRVKWSPKPENLHVTLKFLGPVAEPRLAEIGEALDVAFANVPRFDFVMRGLGAFPTPACANVLFAGVDERGGRDLALAAGRVEAALERFGFPRETRPFTAHVTVGRSKDGVDIARALAPWAERDFGAVTVDEVHLYESQLARRGDAGSTYVLRSRTSLATTSRAN